MPDWSQAEDATAKNLPRTIEKAEDGDVHAKLRLLEIFTSMIDNHETPYPELLAYLSKHISNALEEKKAIAVHVGRELAGNPGHRPPSPDAAFIKEERAFLVEIYKARGETVENAIAMVAEELNAADETVRQAYKEVSKNKSFKHLVALLAPTED